MFSGPIEEVQTLKLKKKWFMSTEFLSKFPVFATFAAKVRHLSKEVTLAGPDPGQLVCHCGKCGRQTQKSIFDFHHFGANFVHRKIKRNQFPEGLFFFAFLNCFSTLPKKFLRRSETHKEDIPSVQRGVSSAGLTWEGLEGHPPFGLFF